MAGFSNIRNFVDTELDGKTRLTSWRKAPTQVTVANFWFDLSMSPGNPAPQYYASAPLVTVQMKQSTDGGLFHGATSSVSKWVKNFMIMSTSATGLPMPIIMLDYLLYYPFIDQGVTDPQSMTNSLALPRYTDGAGVKIMAVNVAAGAGGQTFTVSYTNSDGVAGRTTPLITLNIATAIGSICSGSTSAAIAAWPFLPLQVGDTGVRSIESLTMNGPDVGLITLVLVKPIFTSQIIEQTAPVDENFFIEKASIPEIKEDAYLNLICMPNGSLSGVVFHGLFQTLFI